MSQFCTEIQNDDCSLTILMGMQSSVCNYRPSRISLEFELSKIVVNYLLIYSEMMCNLSSSLRRNSSFEFLSPLPHPSLTTPSPIIHHSLTHLSLYHHSLIPHPSLATPSTITHHSLYHHSTLPLSSLTTPSTITHHSHSHHSPLTHPALSTPSPLTHHSLSHHSPLPSLTTPSPITHYSPIENNRGRIGGRWWAAVVLRGALPAAHRGGAGEMSALSLSRPHQ